MTHNNSSKMNDRGQPMHRLRLPALLLALSAAGLAHAELVIQSVVAASQGGAEVVRIQTSEAMAQTPNVFAIQSPARIALDFPGASNGVGRNLIEINRGNLKSANVVEAGDRTRVVLNLNQPVKYETRVDGNALLVVLEPPAQPSVASSDTPSRAATFAASSRGDVVPLNDIDFRRGEGSTGRIIVNLANNETGVDIRPQGKTLVVEFLSTSLPEGLRRRLDVSDFGTPVKNITTTQIGDKVRMVVEPTGLWEHSAYQSNNQFVLEVREQKVDPNKLSQGPGYTGERLSLNFQSIDVRSLLQVIADFTNFNIITSDTVTGTVTLRLKDVPWDQALDIILQAKGLGMRKTGNVIWVAPKDEIAAREKADYEAAAQVQTLEPLRTKSFQMNYAKAVDIAAQLRGEVPGQPTGGAAMGGQTTPTTRILSNRGSVIPEPRTNQLFVTDIPSRLEQIEGLIAKLDIPVRQIMIEARIVEANDTFGKSLGMRLGGADLRGIRGGTAGYSLGGSGRVAFGGSYNAVTATTTESLNSASQSPTSNFPVTSSGGTDVTGRPLDTINSSFVNLPAVALAGASPASFALALFSPSSNRFLNLEISALQADGKGKVVSSPRVITADQTKASIEQGTEYPYQAATSSGATQVQFKKAVMKLEVTPQITPEGAVILEVEISKDSPGEILNGQRAINTKRIKTSVLVENGGTVVIGGIYESEETENISKVPLLGDIPAVGNLFKRRTQTADKKELLVFLTPRTLTDGLNPNN